MGCCVSHLGSLVARVVASDSHLYVALVEDKVLELAFEEMVTGKLKTYVNHEYNTPIRAPRLVVGETGSR